MIRRVWPAFVLVAGLAGCQETDPTKINNSVPTADSVGAAGAKGEGGGAAEVQGKTGGAFTAGPGGVKGPPPGYPVPETAQPAADAPKAEEAKPLDAPKLDDPKIEAPKSAALTESEIEAIKKLPEADQAIALEQQVCLISGEHLGAMGTPLKVESDGKVGFLCCKGCKADFEKDPAAAFAKRDAK